MGQRALSQGLRSYGRQGSPRMTRPRAILRTIPRDTPLRLYAAYGDITLHSGDSSALACRVSRPRAGTVQVWPPVVPQHGIACAYGPGLAHRCAVPGTPAQQRCHTPASSQNARCRVPRCAVARYLDARTAPLPGGGTPERALFRPQILPPPSHNGLLAGTVGRCLPRNAGFCPSALFPP